MTFIDTILGRESKDDKIKALQQQIAALQAAQTKQSTNIERLDVRLDQYGSQLATMFGGMVTAHKANRWSAETTVAIDEVEVYQLTAVSDLSGATLTFVGKAHQVAPLTLTLKSQPGSDFTPADLQDIEDWITHARTGIAVDHNRHFSRKTALDKLLEPAEAKTTKSALPASNGNGDQRPAVNAIGQRVEPLPGEAW